MPPDLNSLPPSHSPPPSFSSALQPRTHPAASSSVENSLPFRSGSGSGSGSPLSAEGVLRRSSSSSTSASASASAPVSASVSQRDHRPPVLPALQSQAQVRSRRRSSERWSHVSNVEHDSPGETQGVTARSEGNRGAGVFRSHHHHHQSQQSVQAAQSTHYHPAVMSGNSHSLAGGSSALLGGYHHQRAPSLGELHQELEQEQEAQVNRLLEMIRQQQAQLQQMQHQSTSSNNNAAAGEPGDLMDDSTPTSERSFSFPTAPAPAAAAAGISVATSYPRSPSASLPLSIANPHPRSPAPTAPRGSFDLSRHSSRRSRTPSHAGSPALRPLSAGIHPHSGDEWLLSGGGGSGGGGGGSLGSSRDESAFYQAETQMLTRENQMLRLRIRELERQINEANSAMANTPITPSNLTAPPLEANVTSSPPPPPGPDPVVATEQENKD